MNVAFLGLGGNLGNRLQNLNDCLNLIASGCGQILAKSSVYETAAWGSDSDKKYLNMVVKLHTPLSSIDLLAATGSIEKMLGRIRGNEKNSDRSMDVDLLFFNQDILTGEALRIPHPRLHLRKFVLIPLCEIDSDFVHPELNQTMTQLLKACPDQLDVVSFQ